MCPVLVLRIIAVCRCCRGRRQWLHRVARCCCSSARLSANPNGPFVYAHLSPQNWRYSLKGTKLQQNGWRVWWGEGSVAQGIRGLDTIWRWGSSFTADGQIPEERDYCFVPTNRYLSGPQKLSGRCGDKYVFWCRIHLWFRLRGGLQAKSMTSQRNRAVRR